MLTAPSQLAPTAFAYVDCDVPEGMTLDQWRRRDRGAPPRRRFARIRSLRLATR